LEALLLISFDAITPELYWKIYLQFLEEIAGKTTILSEQISLKKVFKSHWNWPN
jgi:hypothetical protein